jgi:hypothetical protein
LSKNPLTAAISNNSFLSVSIDSFSSQGDISSNNSIKFFPSNRRQIKEGNLQSVAFKNPWQPGYHDKNLF